MASNQLSNEMFWAEVRDVSRWKVDQKTKVV